MKNEFLLQAATWIFGATGLISWIFSYRERVLKNKTTEATIFEKMQGSYQKFVDHTEHKLAEMRGEIEMLHSIIKKQREECANCSNSKNRNNG